MGRLRTVVCCPNIWRRWLCCTAPFADATNLADGIRSLIARLREIEFFTTPVHLNSLWKTFETLLPELETTTVQCLGSRLCRYALQLHSSCARETRRCGATASRSIRYQVPCSIGSIPDKQHRPGLQTARHRNVRRHLVCISSAGFRHAPNDLDSPGACPGVTAAFTGYCCRNRRLQLCA